MGTLVRWQLGSLVYLLLVLAVVQVVGDSNPDFNLYRLTELALLLPGTAVWVWVLAIQVPRKNYDVANAAGYTCTILPLGVFLTQEQEVGASVINAWIFLVLASVIFLITAVKLHGLKIVPWLTASVTIYTSGYYLALFGEIWPEPILVVLIGMVFLATLYICAWRWNRQMLQPL